jgi:alpha-glucosidase
MLGPIEFSTTALLLAGSYVTVFLLPFSYATPSEYSPLQHRLASAVHSLNVSSCSGTSHLSMGWTLF